MFLFPKPVPRVIARRFTSLINYVYGPQSDLQLQLNSGPYNVATSSGAARFACRLAKWFKIPRILTFYENIILSDSDLDVALSFWTAPIKSFIHAGLKLPVVNLILVQSNTSNTDY